MTIMQYEHLNYKQWFIGNDMMIDAISLQLIMNDTNIIVQCPMKFGDNKFQALLHKAVSIRLKANR